MATSIGFYLSAVIAAAIIFIGGRFLLAPSLAAAGYGDTRNGVPVLWPERGASAVTPDQAAMAGFSHPRMHEDRILHYVQQGQFDWTLPTMSGGDTCYSTELIAQ
jgi:hypothetical protein